MADRPRWIRANDAGAAASAAGRLVAEHLQHAGPDARLAIPGGSALAAVHEAKALLGDGWRTLRLTWVDERCVPLASPDSNRAEAQRAGLLEPAPRATLPLFLDGETPDEAVARVERRLTIDFESALDVALLGMGPDGHVASLFPGVSFPPEASQTSPRAHAAHVTGSPKPPADRITLTRRMLASAARVVLLATGEGKRDALARLRAADPALPATGLAGLCVVTDLEIPEAPRSE